MLTKDQIMQALQRLSDELKALGKQGEILLTGGASMCLVHSARDMTKDIDALYEPKSVINQLVSKIAEMEGLPEDWLNDSVKGFVSDGAPCEDYLSLPNLKVTTVSADYLLAMKLMSARYGAKDYDDIRFLAKKLGIATEASLREIVTTYYPPERILPKTRYLIEQLVEELQGDKQCEVQPAHAEERRKHLESAARFMLTNNSLETFRAVFSDLSDDEVQTAHELAGQMKALQQMEPSEQTAGEEQEPE